MLAEHAPRTEQQPNQTLSFRPVDSPEFQRAIAGVRIGKTEHSELMCYQPPDWTYSNNTLSQSESISVSGRWLLPNAAAQNEFAIALHGYGCSHKVGRSTESNYFDYLCAALEIPLYAFDWPGYNTKRTDRKTIEQNPWMAKIDQYPYILLQMLESFIEKIPSEVLSSNSTAPIVVHLIGHSVGGRSLAVAASVNEGNALARIRDNWQRQLGRAVQFKLTLLQPAFGIQTDVKIDAIGWADNKLFKKIISYAPEMAIWLIQELVGTQAVTYGVDRSLRKNFQVEDLDMLTAHPAELYVRPRKTILNPSQLSALGIEMRIILAGKDKVADNEVTRELFARWFDSHIESWPHLKASVGNDCFSVSSTDSRQQSSTQSAELEGLGHTSERTHPDLVAQILRRLHAN